MYELVFRSLINILPVTNAAPELSIVTPVVVRPQSAPQETVVKPQETVVKSRSVTFAESNGEPAAELRTNISMAELGVGGESLVGSTLRGLYPAAAVTHTAKTACCADVRFIMNNISIAVEVKSYSRTVPSAELDKFRRDLVMTTSKYGIFVSLNGVGITGITDIISDEVTADYKMIIIIANKDTIKFLLKTAVDALMREERRANIDKTAVDEVIKSNTAALYELQRLRQCFNKDKNDIDLKIQNINSALSRVAMSIESASANINIAGGEQVEMIPMPPDVKAILAAKLPPRWKCIKKNKTSSEYVHCDNANIKIMYNKDAISCAMAAAGHLIPKLVEMNSTFEYSAEWLTFPLSAATAVMVVGCDR